MNGVAKSLGEKAFKKYAKDYGSSRIDLNDSVEGVIDALWENKCDDDLLSHFTENRSYVMSEYGTEEPFYKSADFKQQCEEERKEFGYCEL